LEKLLFRYLGNAVSTADHFDPSEAKKWKKDVLEAYLGVTLKRLFATGPEAFEEIYQRLKQFTESLAATEVGNGVAVAQDIPEEAGPQALPQAVLDTVTSLAFAIDAKDHYTQGHSQKVSAYAALIAEAMEMNDAEIEEIRLGAVLHDIGKVGIPEQILNKSGPLNPEEWETMRKRHKHGDEQIKAIWQWSRGLADSYDDMNFTPPYLSTITAHTLIVHGDRDPFYPANIALEMYAAIRGSHLWVIPNGGHVPIFGDVTRQFVETTLAFLRGGWGRPSK
jgi:pimeloyl-ACP methyl ester carboxylesterase